MPGKVNRATPKPKVRAKSSRKRDLSFDALIRLIETRRDYRARLQRALGLTGSTSEEFRRELSTILGQPL